MVREALQVTEVAIKLSALGIKNALALSLAYAKENPKVKGKTSLDRLLREGKELKIIALQSKDVGQFKELAKQYGVLFAVIKKYNLLHHPNVKYTSDAGGEPYVMAPDYMGDAVTITMGAVAAATAPEITEEMYEQLDYLEKHPEENYYENEENFSQYDQGD